jgi:hypothetical protein
MRDIFIRNERGKMGNTYFKKFIFCLLSILLPFYFLAPACTIFPKRSRPQITRISPKEARDKIQSGEAILVCSYEDLKCKDILLDGAILRSEFEGRLGELSKDQEIIFYCG